MGHFSEAVIETRDENYKLRWLKIFYFIEDNTISISEEK
jgi:hypothetical protein